MQKPGLGGPDNLPCGVDDLHHGIFVHGRCDRKTSFFSVLALDQGCYVLDLGPQEAVRTGNKRRLQRQQQQQPAGQQGHGDDGDRSQGGLPAKSAAQRHPAPLPC